MKINKRLAILLLVILVFFHSINNLIVLKSNKLPMFGNDANLAIESLRLYSSLKKGDLISVFFYRTIYPTLICILPSFFYLFFGTAQNIPPLINIPFMGILIFSIYGIGKKIHSKKAGLLAAFIVMTFPHIFGLSRIYYYDFPLMCCLTLTIYFLLKTDNFLSLKYSVLLGLSMALSAAFKSAFSIYLIGPFSVYLFCSIMNKEKIHDKIRNVLISLFVFFLFTSYFYVFNIGALLEHDFHAINLWYEPSNDMTRLHYLIPNLKYYLTSLVGYQILHFYFFIFLFSFIFSIVSPKKNKLLILSWILIPLLFFSFYVPMNLDLRFILPILPAIAILISLFILGFRSKQIKKFLTLSVLLIGTIQFFFVSYLPNYHYIVGSVNREFHLDPANIFMHDIHGPMPVRIWHYGLFYPIKYDWGLYEIVKIVNQSLNQKKPLNMLTFVNNFESPLNYLFKLNNIDINSYTSTPNQKFLLSDFDYLILSNIYSNEEAPLRNFFAVPYYDLSLYNLKNYDLIGNIFYPENITVFIYKKNSSQNI